MKRDRIRWLEWCRDCNATCQRHKVEPLAYLRDVLTRIAAHPASRLAELLPTPTPPA